MIKLLLKTIKTNSMCKLRKRDFKIRDKGYNLLQEMTIVQSNKYFNHITQQVKDKLKVLLTLISKLKEVI